MKVESILKAKGNTVETVSPDAELNFVVNRLSTLGIGALVVSPDGTKIAGTVSERDIVRGLNKHGGALLDLQAKDVMSRTCPTCSTDDLLQRVMAVMTNTRHRHIPVLDASGNLCGIVSIGDLVKHKIDQLQFERDQLDSYVHQL